MLKPSEYLLKADNFATAALTTHEGDKRLRLLHISAMYRNKALVARLGKRSGVLRRCPFKRDELRAM